MRDYVDDEPHTASASTFIIIIPLELIDEVKRNGKALASNTFREDRQRQSIANPIPKAPAEPGSRMAEVNNRPDVMTKATLASHGRSDTGCVGYEPRRQQRRNWSKLYKKAL